MAASAKSTTGQRSGDEIITVHESGDSAMYNKPVAKSYTVSDGKLVLTLTNAEEGGFVVTSPVEPELITEADTIDDAFRMAHDALRALRASRTKLLRQIAGSRRRSA